MSTRATTPIAAVDSLAHAQSLYEYAAERLDPFSLRCWIIQRLMYDDGLEHECAETMVARVLASASKESRGRKWQWTPSARELDRTLREARTTCAERWSRSSAPPERAARWRRLLADSPAPRRGALR